MTECLHKWRKWSSKQLLVILKKEYRGSVIFPVSYIYFLYAKLYQIIDSINIFLNLMQRNVSPKKMCMLSFVKQWELVGKENLRFQIFQKRLNFTSLLDNKSQFLFSLCKWYNLMFLLLHLLTDEKCRVLKSEPNRGI